MHSELCSRCGSCVALSGGKVKFIDREGKYLPQIKIELSEEEIKTIHAACPGKEFNFPYYHSKLFPESTNHHNYIGSYESIFIGFATDEEVRRNAASGGILSAILIYLLNEKLVDGVITTRMSKTKPWLTEPFIAKTRNEVLEAAQSKYIITSVNEILVESSGFKGKLAYIGLPSQVHSIRKLQESDHPFVQNIHFIFGPFYGNTLYFSSVRSFLRSHGEKDYREIKNLWFRHGEWPGNMRVEMKSGKSFELKKFHANYLIPFHILKNSLYCTDFTNEFTDISGGDAWAPVYEERGKGFSLVIARSRQGRTLLEEMSEKGLISLKPIDTEEAIRMHSHGYDFKKRGSFIRIRMRKWSGKDVPDWGYENRGFPISRWVMEGIISFLFLVLGTCPARWLVDQLPSAFIGKIFEKSRDRWKKSTRSIKRKDLG